MIPKSNSDMIEVRKDSTSTPAAIEFNKVSKSYSEGEREHHVLREMNLFLSRGEIIVLLGRSGSGKSTILNLISGIDLPSSGHILAGGESLSNMTEEKRTLFRRQNIGFVFQFFNLIP
ncbi:MAG: ATP-binding cassette domain-containing protein, partial [Calditrichia bacterium]